MMMNDEDFFEHLLEIYAESNTKITSLADKMKMEHLLKSFDKYTLEELEKMLPV